MFQFPQHMKRVFKDPNRQSQFEQNGYVIFDFYNEEEIKFADEKVIVPGVSLIQRERNTNQIYLGYSSPKTQARTYLYNLKT